MTDSRNRILANVGQSITASGIISSAETWTTARTITLDGDVSGSVSIDGSENVTLTTTVGSDTVVLGTDTTGNYIATATGGTGITVTGSGNETADITIAIDNTVATLSGAETLTNKTIDAASNTLSNIGNSSLTNNSVTINSNSLSLGGTLTLDTDDVSEGSTNLYYTDARAQGAFTAGDNITIVDGVISGSAAYGDSDARAAISVTDSGGDGSLSYNSSTGVITYTGPSASEVRAHFTGGTGITITNGEISIGQAVATNSDVTFNDVTVSGNLTVSGTTTTINTETINLADNTIVLNSNETGTPSQNSGIEIERGTSTNAALLWDETNDYWVAGVSGSEVPLVTTSGTQTLTNKTFDAANNTLSNIANSSLTNSSVTINSNSLSLGGTLTLYTDDVSEGSTNLYYTNARTRAAISVTDSGGDGSLSYNSTTGVLTYTGPSASEVRSHFTAGTGINIVAGQISVASGFVQNYTDADARAAISVSGTGLSYNNTTGVITLSGYNNSNWDTAYGWGNHASAGYQSAATAITTSNIGSQSVNYAASAGNADTVDSVHATSFLRSDASDTFTGQLTMGTQTALVASDYGHGVYGVYSPTRYQHVWSMGTAYSLPANGLDESGNAGNLYGLAWSYNPNYSYSGSNPQAKSGLNHQLLLMMNGITYFAAGEGMWTSGTAQSTSNMRAPIFYDSNNTAYYVDPASTGTSLNIAGVINTTAPGGSVIIKHSVSEVDAWLFQENANNWGLYWKNNPSGQHTFGQYTSVGAELVGMSAANSSGNGVQTSNYVGATSAYAQWMLSNYTGYMWSASTIYAQGDMRAPIFYDSNNTAYYVDPASSGTSVNVRGVIQNPSIWINDGDEYNNYNENIRLFNAPNGVSVIAFSASGTSGQPTTSILGFSDRHEIRFGGNWQTRVYNGYAEAAGSYRAPIFYDSNDTGYYLDPNSTSDAALRVRGGTLYGPNTTWNSYLMVGGNGRNSYINNSSVASVASTNGNLHMDAASGYDMYLNYYDGGKIYFGNGDNSTGGLYQSGNLTVTGNITAYGSASDISFKENIESLKNSLNIIKNLRGVKFNWKKDTLEHNMTGIDEDYGFIAQEVQEVIPKIVRKNNNDKLSLRDKAIIPFLVEAIKEQQKLIEEQETRINSLEKLL